MTARHARSPRLRRRRWVGVTVLVALLLAVLFASSAVGSDGERFDGPYAGALEDLAARGIVAGRSPDALSPIRWVTRQEFAKMIVLTLGLAVTDADICPFTDVPRTAGSSLYPDHYVAAAARHRIILGMTLTLFAPQEEITRAQLVAMATRGLGLFRLSPLTEGPLPPTNRVSTGDDSLDATLCEAECVVLTRGLQDYGASWDLWAPASLGEVARVLVNLMDELGRGAVTPVASGWGWPSVLGTAPRPSAAPGPTSDARCGTALS